MLPLLGHFWLFWAPILVVFLYLLRAVKLFLIKVCKDGFCIIPMLTALKKIHSKSSSPGRHFGVFFGLAYGIFFPFLDNRLVSFKIFQIYY